MQEKINPKTTFDWIARALLTLQVLAIMSGYFNYVQLSFQLLSPLIPKSTISAIMLDSADPLIYRCIYMGLAFLISLWVYFFRKYMEV
jgi:hypothetical protein